MAAVLWIGEQQDVVALRRVADAFLAIPAEAAEVQGAALVAGADLQVRDAHREQRLVHRQRQGVKLERTAGVPRTRSGRRVAGLAVSRQAV